MLSNRSAIVTGSTSGIGLGIARSFADAGINVMLNGFGDADDIENARAALQAKGVLARHHGADMSRPGEITELVRTAEAEFGAVDIIVNNAGIQTIAPVEELPVEKWEAILAINLSSAFHMTRAALPGMKSRGWGRIINVASAHGLVASPFKSAYVAAKHGAVGFTRCVALEAAMHGVTCNAICPGYVLTPLVEKQIPETARARGLTVEQVKRDVLLSEHATGEFVTVEQIGALALFLCSDAAAQITGAALPVDGGWTAH